MNGDSLALQGIAFCYIYGRAGLPIDKTTASWWLFESAKRADSERQYEIGQKFEKGEVFDKDETLASKCYLMAAQQGGFLGAFSSAESLRHGMGVEADLDKSKHWYLQTLELAKFKEETELRNYIIETSYFSLGLTCEGKEAIHWYKKAAERGVPEAMYNIGVLLSQGEGVIASKSAAIDWFYKAGIAYLAVGNKDSALRAVDRINSEIRNHFLGEKLLAEIYGNEVQIKDNSKNEQDNESTEHWGTGWAVDTGYVVTCYHVVDNTDNITLHFQDGSRVSAEVAVADKANDIVLLRPSRRGMLPPGLQLGLNRIKPGAEIFTIGFPHPETMGFTPKVTEGTITSLTGYQDDPRLFQISVPVQAGNSGGPLINLNGEVIGLVTAKLSALAMFARTGDLPQNVNYAIKSQYLDILLKSTEPVEDISQVKISSNTLEALVELLQGSIVLISAE